MTSNKLRVISLLAVWCLLAPNGIDGKSKPKKLDQLIKAGQTAEAKGDWDAAMDFYMQAFALDPSDIGAMLFMRRARFQASQKHVEAGERLRSEGKLEDAVKEFEKAIYADPSSAIAIQDLKTTQKMIRDSKKPGAKAENIGLTPYEVDQNEASERADQLQGPPDLKPITRRIHSLKMNNQPPKVLYETVGKLAGINVIFDPQYTNQGKTFNVDLNDSTLDQALDYLAMLTKTFWKPISSNTIFIAEDNIQKRRDYEDVVVKVFYVSNATSVQEFQEVATAVRSLLQLRNVYTYNAQKALLVRGTVDQVALAEQIVRDLDKPKSEVLVDFVVMQVNTTHTRDLAATIFAGGLNMPVAYTPQGGTVVTPPSDNSGGGNNGGNNNGGNNGGNNNGGGNDNGGGSTNGTTVTLGRLARTSINDFSTSLPGALVQAILKDNNTRVLQSPEVRASDGQKASLHIGQKIPYATGSYQPGVGTVGVSPLVSTQFNFAEVGVNIDMTPQVHGTDEVTLHLQVEISNVAQYVDLGGIQEPVIAQEKNDAEIRMRSGEVNLLGGLSQITDSRTRSGLPGLINIPVLGHLFGNETKERDRTELLIAVIPHVVRTPNFTAENLKTIAAGSEAVVRLSRAPAEEEATPGQPAAPAAPSPVPAALPPAPGAGARLMFLPSSVQARVSGPVTVSLRVENAEDLVSAPVKIKYDPKILRLNDITPGDLLTRGNPNVTSSKNIRNDRGEATITITRPASAGGVNGSGALANLSFLAIGKGATQIAVTEAGLKNSKQQPVTVQPPVLNITIQ